MTGETEPSVGLFDPGLSFRHPERFLAVIVLYVIDHDGRQDRHRSVNLDVDML